MRGHIRRVAGSWLVLQLLVTVWVPAALMASTHHESAVEECTCEHPTGGVCPMHRHSTTSPTSPSAGCALRGALDPLDGLVASLIGTTGVIPALVSTIASTETSAHVPDIAPAPLNRLVPPDSPPPRV